jgi:hypothetical protein
MCWATSFLFKPARNAYHAGTHPHRRSSPEFEVHMSSKRAATSGGNPATGNPAGSKPRAAPPLAGMMLIWSAVYVLAAWSLLPGNLGQRRRT